MIQPFREDTVMGVCGKCGDAIYAGDLAYVISGETICMSCIEDSAFITPSGEVEKNICLGARRIPNKVRQQISCKS